MANTIIRGGGSTRVVIEPPSLVDVLAQIAAIQTQIVTIDTKVTAILGGGGVVAPTTLSALSLAAASIQEASVAGTVVGGVIGRTTGSTLSLVDTIGNRFALSGTNLVAGTTPLDYEAATTYQVTVRETLAGATNSPRDTLFNITVINVFEVPPLGALSFANAGSLKNGTTATGAIAGATAGSAIVASGLPAGFTINGPARTWAFDGTTPDGTTNVTLTETLGDSSNSPRQTGLAVVVAAAAPFVAPTLTRTSANGTNPPEFTMDTGDAQVGVHDFTLEQYQGATNVPPRETETVPFNSDFALAQEDDAGYDWATLGPDAEPAGEWQARIKVTKSSDGSFVAYSNFITDTLVTPLANVDTAYDPAFSDTDSNPNNNNNLLVFSNSNLTAKGGDGNPHSGRSTNGISTGKHAFAFTVDAATPPDFDNDVAVGIGQSDRSQYPALYSGTGTASVNDRGAFGLGGGSFTNVTALAAGVTGVISVNASTNKLWLSLNGVNQNGDPVAGTGGLDISSLAKPWFAMASMRQTGQVSLNFNAALPSGFGRWKDSSNA